MVTVHVDVPTLRTIIVTPDWNCSWVSNRLCIISLLVPLSAICVFMLYLGAWPVIPLAGAEIIFLAWVLRDLCRKMLQHQVIHIKHETLHIEQGIERPQQHWTLVRQRTELSIIQKDSTLTLKAPGIRINLGRFTLEQERKKLIALLSNLRPIGPPIQQVITH